MSLDVPGGTGSAGKAPHRSRRWAALGRRYRIEAAVVLAALVAAAIAVPLTVLPGHRAATRSTEPPSSTVVTTTAVTTTAVTTTAVTTTAVTTTAVPRTAPAKVAVVHAGVLSVVDETTGRSLVLARGPWYGELGSAINTPGFSPDGKWVAYLETVAGSSSLHVVPASGGTGTTVDGAESYAWSPRVDELAVSLAGRVELLSPAGTVLRRWAMPYPGPELFSPSGGEIEVSSRVVSSPTGRLLVVAVRGGPARTLISRPGLCQIPAGWTADGTWALSWQDEDCSASLAADGLPLEAVPGSGGRTVALGRTLVYTRWVVPVSGVTLLVNTGTDRVAVDGKALRSCDAATGACSRLPLPAGTSSLDPALAAATDQLFEVRVRQSAAYDFYPEGTLWVGTRAGTGERELTAAGRGVADPVPSANGSTVTFARMTSATSVTVEVLTVRSGLCRILASVDDDDYYGELNAPAVLAVWQPPR